MTVEGQTVLDPMMGSGMTGVSATKLQRKFIGIESDDKAYRVAKANITRAGLLL
jgi:DNA modification methylase